MAHVSWNFWHPIDRTAPDFEQPVLVLLETGDVITAVITGRSYSLGHAFERMDGRRLKGVMHWRPIPPMDTVEVHP